MLGLTAALALSVPVGAQDAPATTPEEVQTLLLDPATNLPDTAVHFVGVTSDPNVYVAVVDGDDGTVSIYLCDGADVSVWLDGTLAEGAFEAASADGGASATGTSDGATASGTVTLTDGSTLDFSAPLAVPPAGLYTREFVYQGVPTQSRTIQLPDGTAKGQSSAAKCESYEIRFDTGMDVWRTATVEATRIAGGNAAARAFRDAKRAKCSWISQYPTS